MVFVLKVNDLLPDICQWFKHLMPIRQSIILPTILNWVLNTIMLHIFVLYASATYRQVS